MIRSKSIGLFVFLVFTGVLSLAQDGFIVSSLHVNSDSKELAPAFYMKGIVFCSDRRSDFLTSYTDYRNAPLTNLYYSERRKDGRFDHASLFSKQLTTFMYEGPSCFNKDGNMIFFTRSMDVSTRNKNRNRSDTTFGIFIARKVNGNWSTPIGFSFNSKAYNTGYPSVSDDGSMLFFCSDAPGGMGGFDIYVSLLKGGIWSEPRNLGPNVNTTKNEVFPFIHKDRRLYFASRGLNEHGDLDIYYTVEAEGTWQKPVRLEAPFNSASDDFGLIFNTNLDTAFFVSDRNGSDDIFSAYSSGPQFADCPAQKVNDYCYVFYESNSGSLDTAVYEYEWDMGDGTKIRAIEAEHCYAEPGDYLVQLNVVDRITGEIMVSQASYNFSVEKIQQPYISAPDTVGVGEPVIFNGKESYIKNATIRNYYWDFGDGSRLQGITANYTYKVPGKFNIRLGVTGEDSTSGQPIGNSCVTRQIVVMSKP